MPGRCLLIFTKPAAPGRVKTRLIGELSAEEAARLHAAFLEDLAARLRGGDFTVRLAWAVEEGEPMPPGRLPATRQRGRDLGERLHRGLAEALEDHEAAAAVGSDHPELPRASVERAFALLDAGAEVVLGPAADGGYYLVAVRRSTLRPEIFADIEWSTERVLSQTLERCRRLGLAVALLPEAADVDTPADLTRLAGALASGAGDCPRTRALLESWGRL